MNWKKRRLDYFGFWHHSLLFSMNNTMTTIVFALGYWARGWLLWVETVIFTLDILLIGGDMFWCNAITRSKNPVGARWLDMEQRHPWRTARRNGEWPFRRRTGDGRSLAAD